MPRKRSSKRKRQQDEFDRLSKVFVSRIVPIYDLFLLFQNVRDQRYKKFDKNLKSFLKKRYITSEGKIAKLQIEHPQEFRALIATQKELNELIFARTRIPSAFLSLLLEEYETFVQKCLQLYFQKKSYRLYRSDKTLSYEEILKVNSALGLKERIFQKESKKIIDDGVSGIIKWFQHEEIQIQNYLFDIWMLAEIFQRRNMHVHNLGRVDEKYISVLKNAEFPNHSKLKIGERLPIDSDYLEKALEAFIESGIIIATLLWMKCSPKDKNKRMENLYELGYKLLEEHKYGCSGKVLNFAQHSSMTIGSKKELKIINIINLATAYKLSGDRKKFKSTLSLINRTELDERFQFAIAVLEHKYVLASELMKKIGRNGSIRRDDYHEWPLLAKFRKTKLFIKTYKGIFGDNYNFKSPFTSRVFKNIDL